MSTEDSSASTSEASEQGTPAAIEPAETEVKPSNKENSTLSDAATAAQSPENLRQCFDELRREKDSLLRAYRLIQEAETWKVPSDKFEAMFQQYCRERALGSKPLDWLKKLAELFGQFSILFGLVLFITEADSRRQQANDQAWGIIIAAQQAQSRFQNTPGDASHLGRIAALEALNKGCREQQEAAQRDWLTSLWPGYWPLWRSKCATLRGLWLNDIYLPAVQLPWANLRSGNFRNAGLWSANLEHADLSNSILEGAQLDKASLAGANLTGASLSRATLRGTDFAETILLGTDLSEVRGLTLRQLQSTEDRGDGPIICRAVLPTGFSANITREEEDCQMLPEILYRTYPQQFDTIESAQQLVDSYKKADTRS